MVERALLHLLDFMPVSDGQMAMFALYPASLLYCGAAV